jgi:hypothetical protein|nr:MAG TPA: Large polyvalent protein associated domain 38 [Caudoviricetes sp.]
MDFFKGIGDFFGGLFGKKKKQKEVNSLQQPSQPRPQPNTLSSQTDLGSAKFNPSTNFESKPDYSFKTTALTPSTKPVNDATDFSKDNTSGLKLDLNNRFKSNGNKFTLGGSSRIENTAIHEDDINNTIKQINDRYHNERDSLGRFWGSFTGDTDRRDKELRRKILTDEMKKITDGLGSNPDGSHKRDYTDDEAYKMATLQLAMRHGIDSQPLKAFVPTGSIDKKPIDSNTMGEWSLATARTIKNMTDGEDGIGGLVGNTLLGKRKTDEGFNLGRFIADLPAGMVAGGAGIGSGISDALSGKRMLDDGTIQDLNGLQRFGSGLDAAISAFGLPSGGSGTLLRSIFKNEAKQAAKEVGKTGVKEVAKRIAKDLAKNAASEGLEEGIQQIAQNLSNTDNYDANGNFKAEKLMDQVGESTALGALGGGIMSGVGLGINSGKTKLGELSQNIRQDIDQKINPQTNPVQNAVAKIEANNSLKYSLSQNQENFFKDSMIRDANGDLMPVYHGTNQDFNQFEDSKIQKADLGRGFYFTDNKDIANNYAEIRANERGGKGKVMETFLNVKNPFDLNYQPREAALDYLTYYFANNGQTNTQASNSAKTLLDMSIADGDIVDGDYSSVFNTKEPEFEKWAKSKGYDGIVVSGGDQDSGLSGNAYVVFEPNQIKSTKNLNPTDSPDIRYKNDTTQDIQSFSEQNLRKIIGNEYDIISKASDNTPRTAQGYADLKNGIVSILDGKMSTANHEATHIAVNALTDANPKLANSALNSIINSYGADTLISEANKSGYGDILGHKLEVTNIDDVRYAAEERLANDFAKYAEAKAKGRENYYAKKNSIPAQIKAWFDRVIDHLKDMASRLDSAHNFMHKLERGDFANMIDNHVNSMRSTDNNVLTTNPQMAYRIDPETNIVHIDNDILQGVSPKNRTKVISQYFKDNYQGNDYDLDYGKDGTVHISAKSRKKYLDPNQSISELILKGKMTGELPDILRVSQKIGEAPDTKNHSFANRGFEYRQSFVQIGNELYSVKLNVGLNDNGKLFYTINGIKKAPESHNRDLSGGDINTLSQTSSDVKMRLDENSTKNDTMQNADRADTEQEETPRQDIADNDVKDYVKDQVENQKKSTSGGLMQKIRDIKDQLRHHLIDDSTAYEQYLSKGNDKESKLAKEALKEDIRNDIDKVRSSDMIAQQFIRDNGLAELGKMSTKDLNQFQQYLIARRHAADLHKQGINTGRDLDMDLAIIDKYKKKFTEQEKIYRNFNKQLLNYMEDNGLISKELHNKLNQNTAYTPYQRLMDDVSSFTGHSQQLGNLGSEQVIKKMKGSDRTILNPIEATMSNTMRIINEGQRNIAARKIAENAFNEHRLRDGQKPRAGYDTLNFMENGKKVSYEVPKMVASEMKRLNRVLPEGVEKVISVLSMPAKTLRGGATSLNPIFAASNLIRDQLQTTITGNIGTNIKGAPKALLATFGFGEKADNLRAELSRQGIIGSEYRQTYGYKQGDLMAELQKEHHLSKKVADRLKHPIDALNDLIGRTEYFTRAQQYFGTDGDITAKSQAARNNTLNFSRGGEAIMVINKIVPFLNAGVQGGRQMTAQITKRPARTALALAAWAGIAMAAKGISESDEKKKELYDRVSDYEKKTNLILFDKDAKYNPETDRIDGLVKIPIPQFLYPITDSMNNIKDSPDALLKTASNIFEVFTGLDTENPVNQLTPTAIKPFIEAATNTNTFTKQDIVSDYDKNKLPQDKGAKYTTGAARFLSSLTGVDAPIIDNFIANWSGGLGKDLAKTLTDNPDNQKDGGGIGRIFTEGAYRRFGSAGADSQYKMAMDSGERLKKQLEGYSDFKNLSKEDQEKVKNAIDSDFKQIGSTFGKLERGDEVKNKLSDRQTGLLQGFNSGKYIEEALKSTRQVNKDRLNSENDYDYNEFRKEYEEKSAKGEYSRKSRIDAQNKLRKLEVGKDFSKETRDLYSLGKDDLRNLIESSEDGNKALDNVIAYGDALVKAGIIGRNKFRDRYGNISLSSASSRGRSSGSRSGGTPSYKMNTMSLIRGALKSSSSKSSVSFNRKAATKANTRAIKRLNSSKIKR